MRVMMRFSFPSESANRVIKDGSMAGLLGKMLERLHPEAAYFYPENGRRGGFVVFDLKNLSDLPTITEPLFLELNAAVDIVPVMNADDLKKGLSSVLEQSAAMRR